MKKNWRLWRLFFNFIRHHNKEYRQYLKTEDPLILFNLADQFCKRAYEIYDIEIDVSYEDEASFRNKQVIFVANHQSMFDPFFILPLVNKPCGFFIASDFEYLLKIKKVKEAVEASKSIYIYRSDVRRTAKQIKKANEYVRTSNTSYMIFPEGHIRSEAGLKEGCMEFAPGAFKIAKDNNLLIVPISINSEHIHSTTNYLDMPNPGKVEVYFHRPITPQMYAGKTTKEIAQMARETILTKVK